MIAGRYPKQPYELVPLSVDFVRELIRDNDTIATMQVTARNADTGADTGPAIFDGSPLLGDSLLVKDGVPIRTGTRVIQRVKAGVNGERHVLSFRVVTALGLKWEGDLYLVIEET